ncbi:unnamed protein product [Merluccius merluccius]
MCSYLGLCGLHLEDDKERQLIRDIQQSLRAAIKTLNQRDTAAEARKLLSSSQCAYCTVFMDALLKMFPKETTEAVVLDILLGACSLAPASYQHQCEGLAEMFTKTVLDTLLSQVTPKTVCSLLQLCNWQERPLARLAWADPCAVQSFSCRDVKTAVRCGG